MLRQKKKLALLAVVCILLMAGMPSCSMESQETGENGAYSEDSGEGVMPSDPIADKPAPVQYVYTSNSVTFTEYGDRVEVCDVAGSKDQVYVLMEGKNWEEGDADNQPSEIFYQILSCQPDGSERSVSDKILLPKEPGNVTDIHLTDTGCVTALYQPEQGDRKLLYWDVFQDIDWEREISASEAKLYLKGEDMIVFCEDNGKYRMVSYDISGESGESVNLDVDVFQNAQAVYLRPDGCFLAVKTDMEGVSYAQVYDPASGLAERKSLPDQFSRYQVFPGTSADFLLCDAVGVFHYDVDKGAPIPVFTYMDAGLGIERFRMVRQIDETHFAGIYYEGTDSVLGLFARTEARSDLQVIVLGVFHESDIPKDRILDFNRENNGYRISVKQYVSYSAEMDAYAQFNMDILAGDMPDILVVDSDAVLRNLIHKGLLADVGELIAEDAELSNVEFMENAFDALRVDGVLYQVAPAFAVDTFLAKKSLVGERTGWNGEEFARICQTLPEGMKVITEMSRREYLAAYMAACGNEMIDYDSGACYFDSPEFTAALEFAASLPEEAESFYEGEHSVYLQGSMFDSRYLENKVLLQPVSIIRIRDLCARINGALGEDGAYVGFPSESREGGVLRAYGTNFVLSGQSGHLDGAWAFARYLLTEEYQSGLLDRSGGLPTRRDVFEANVQDAAKFEGFCFINDEYRKLPALTREQLDSAVAFIEGVQHVSFEDATVMNLIYEETEGYFQGQKDVESVVDVIQNRVGLYLQEQME